jgi:hypothetical protein
MAKENPTGVRFTKKALEAVARAAAAENRSVSNYIETLVVAELRAKGFLAGDEK